MDDDNGGMYAVLYVLGAVLVAMAVAVAVMVSRG